MELNALKALSLVKPLRIENKLGASNGKVFIEKGLGQACVPSHFEGEIPVGKIRASYCYVGSLKDIVLQGNASTASDIRLSTMNGNELLTGKVSRQIPHSRYDFEDEYKQGLISGSFFQKGGLGGVAANLRFVFACSGNLDHWYAKAIMANDAELESSVQKFRDAVLLND